MNMKISSIGVYAPNKLISFSYFRYFFLRIAFDFDYICFFGNDTIIYKAFVQKKYSITPEKRKDMNQRMQIMYNLAYKRPHISRTQSNKYAIMGITLKDDYEKKIENFTISQTNDDTLWKETLSQIDSIVPDALYSD